MTWWDAFQIGATILASVGGTGAIILGVSGFLSRLAADRIAEGQRRETETMLTSMRGRLDEGLSRLDATLEHQNFLLQRLSEIELQGIHACWKSAIHCHHLVNGLRPIDCGTDLDALNARLVELSNAHNQLLSVTGEY